MSFLELKVLPSDLGISSKDWFQTIYSPVNSIGTCIYLKRQDGSVVLRMIIRDRLEMFCHIVMRESGLGWQGCWQEIINLQKTRDKEVVSTGFAVGNNLVDRCHEPKQGIWNLGDEDVQGKGHKIWHLDIVLVVVGFLFFSLRSFFNRPWFGQIWFDCAAKIPLHNLIQVETKFADFPVSSTFSHSYIHFKFNTECIQLIWRFKQSIERFMHNFLVYKSLKQLNNFSAQLNSTPNMSSPNDFMYSGSEWNSQSRNLRI